MPSKFFLSTKLTTPAMASDPYTAELPPVTTSMRSMRSVGNVLTSADTALARMSEPTWRRPLTSTRVRWVPRPRRSSRFRPVVPRKRLEFCWLKVLRIDGSSLSRSPTEVLPVSTSSSADTVVTGTGASRFGRAMRDPVTMISCRFSDLSWAMLDPAATTPTEIPTGIAAKCFLVCIAVSLKYTKPYLLVAHGQHLLPDQPSSCVGWLRENA